MNDFAGESTSEPFARRPKLKVVGIVAALIVGLILLALLSPSIAWTGAAWLDVEVHLIDQSMGTAIESGTLILRSDPPARTDPRFDSAAILTAITDKKGRGQLKQMFGAAGGACSTTIVVRSSYLECAAPGYAPRQIPLAADGKLRFSHFPFRGPRNQTSELVVTLGKMSETAVPESVSPDGKLHGVMDVDRDPKISPEWKGDSYPRIEVTEKATGRVLVSIEYFGAAGDDARPLREHVQLRWRSDSKAFAITIEDRFYSESKVFALNKKSKFVEVAFPSYKTMTGFPSPDTEQLRPRGRSSVQGWDSDGRLIYYIFMSPLPSYSGNDPLEHTVLLDVTAEKMVPVKKAKAEQGAAGQPAARPAPK